jgi:Holliday junction DNA helicase RuvA
MAIATGSADMLDMIPGIGKKVASRIILELKEKIGAGLVITPTPETKENTDVLTALTTLGYSAAEAVKAVANLPADPKLKLEEKVKLALQYLGSK